MDLRAVAAGLILLHGAALANPVVQLNAADRARLTQARAQLPHEPANARLFLALVEESGDVNEIGAAAEACRELYARNPSPEYAQVVRHLFAHPDSRVRQRAVSMAEVCLAGDYPDCSFLALIQPVYEAERDPRWRANMLSVLWKCEASDPRVGRLVLAGLRDPEPQVVVAALDVLSTHPRADYGPAFRSQAPVLVQGLFERPEVEVRARVMDAFRVVPAPGLNALFARGLQDPDGAVVFRTLQAMDEAHAVDLLGHVVKLLDDPRPTQLIPSASRAIMGDHPNFGPQTPVQHYALRSLHRLSRYALGSQGFQYAYFDKVEGQVNGDLSGEVARARKWMSAHRDFMLKYSQQ